MICKQCGAEISDHAKYCTGCGTAVGAVKTSVDTVQDEKSVNAVKDSKSVNAVKDGKSLHTVKKGKSANSLKDGKKVTENIFLCPDGKYRWVYEYSMLKNPVILITVFKVLLLSFGIVAGYVMILSVINGRPILVPLDDMERKALTIVSLALLFCLLTGYLIVAASKGFKYCVLFEMDENGVLHKELPKRFKKTQALSALAVIAGLAAKKARRRMKNRI